MVAGATERGIALQEVTDFRSLTGLGVSGSVGGRRIAIGNATLLEQEEAGPKELAERAEKLRVNGQTAVFAAVDGRIAVILGVADPIKESTRDALTLLTQEGVHVIMLT